ncbi:MAG: hypothetical protein V8T62_00590 [Oscillospiraceae bacterium]
MRLPDDIGVLDCREVPVDFHARYGCVGKRYGCLIWNADGKNPFSTGPCAGILQLVGVGKIAGRCANCCAAHMIFGAFAVAKADMECVRSVFIAVKTAGHARCLYHRGGWLFMTWCGCRRYSAAVNEGKIVFDQVRRAWKAESVSGGHYRSGLWVVYPDRSVYMRPDRWGNG